MVEGRSEQRQLLRESAWLLGGGEGLRTDEAKHSFSC